MIVPAAIAEYNKAFPGIDVGLIDARNDQILEKAPLRRGDCAIGTFDDRADGIRREVLAQDALVVFCAPSSALTTQTGAGAISPIRKLVMLTRDSSVRALIDRHLDAAGVPSGKPLYEVSQTTTAVMLVEAGLGAAIAAGLYLVIRPRREIVSRPLIEPQVMRNVYLIQPESRSLSPAAEGFARVRKLTRLAIARVIPK